MPWNDDPAAWSLEKGYSTLTYCKRAWRLNKHGGVATVLAEALDAPRQRFGSENKAWGSTSLRLRLNFSQKIFIWSWRRRPAPHSLLWDGLARITVVICDTKVFKVPSTRWLWGLGNVFPAPPCNAGAAIISGNISSSSCTSELLGMRVVPLGNFATLSEALRYSYDAYETDQASAALLLGRKLPRRTLISWKWPFFELHIGLAQHAGLSARLCVNLPMKLWLPLHDCLHLC